MPDVTSRGTWARDMMHIDEGLLSAKRWEPLDLKDLMVEIVVTLRLPRPLEVINSRPKSAEILCYLSNICSETRAFSRLHTVFRCFGFS